MSADPTRPTTFNIHLEDDSQLQLRREQDRWIAQHCDYEPEPLSDGPLHVLWLKLEGRQGVPRLRVMFLADTLEAEQLALDSPYVKGGIARPFPERRQPWMWPPAIELFRPGEVQARWQVERGRGWHTIGEQHLLLEEWGYVTGDSGLMKS